MDFLHFHNLFDENQHGSRKGHSTISHPENIINALDSGMNIVDLGILHYKLRKIGIRGNIGAWIADLFRDGYQIVTVNGMKSERNP